MFPAFCELALVLITPSKHIDAIPMELVVLPEAQVDVAVAVGVDSSAVASFSHLSHIFRAVVEGDLFEILFELASAVVELAHKLLLEISYLVDRLGGNMGLVLLVGAVVGS